MPFSRHTAELRQPDWLPTRTRRQVRIAARLDVGLAAGLHYGGAAVILHFALRYVLWRHGYLPWWLACFLDYATERISLNVLGSYPRSSALICLP
jgi:hypothetical protein